MHPPYGPANGSMRRCADCLLTGTFSGLPYYGNLRSALALDIYTLKGDAAGETYTPRFTYHGFRYVEVRGYPGTLTADNIMMLHVHTAVLPRSRCVISIACHSVSHASGGCSLTTSSLILNQIQYNAVTGQGSNLMSIPTDCDQRDEVSLSLFLLPL